MIADLKPYPAMKDSGVEWLGDVPEHWEVRKLRSVLRNVTERNRPDLPLLSVVREKGVILRDISNIEENHNFIPDDLTNYKVVRDGQLAMNKMKAWQGSYGVSKHDGIVSPAYFIFDIVGVSGDFFHTAIRSKAYVPFFTQASDGVRIGQWDLSQARMREITFSLPPLPEQAAIVRYLDHVDRRIRRYVRAKQKLIGLLEEQKQAIIHRAVTRGLDPDVPLKDSGVEWLGEVPEHWEVKKLKHLTRFYNGIAFKPSDWAEEGVPIIRIQNLNGSDEFNYTVRKDLPEFLRIRPGDLLFSWSGNRGTSFGSYIWEHDFDGYLNQHIFKLDDYSLDRRYFSYLLRAVTHHVEEQTHGIIGLMHITKPELGRVLVPVAPPREQCKIVQTVDESIARVQTSIDRAHREIELLREYQTRLTTDVVTGKLDVREAAANLPHEPDEIEPLDEADDLVDDPDAMLDGLDAVPEEADAGIECPTGYSGWSISGSQYTS